MALIRGFSPAQFRDAFLGVVGPFQVTADIPSAAAGANSTVAVTGTALAVGDIVISVQPTTLVAGVTYDANVTANGTVSLVMHNGSGGAVDPASQVYTIIALRPKTA